MAEGGGDGSPNSCCLSATACVNSIAAFWFNSRVELVGVRLEGGVFPTRRRAGRMVSCRMEVAWQ